MTRLLVQTKNYFRTMLNCSFMKNRTHSSTHYFRKIAQHSLMNGSTENRSLILKPPNILVYCPGCNNRSEEAIAFIEECLEESRYTVYSITTGRFNTDPWMENTEALIIYTANSLKIRLVEKIQTALKRYLLLGGKVLSFNSQTSPHSSLTKISPEVSPEYRFILKKSANDCVVNLPSHLWDGRAFLESDESSSNACQSLINYDFKDKSCCVAKYFDENGAGIISLVSLLDLTTQKYSPNRQLIMSYLLHCVGLKSKWKINFSPKEHSSSVHHSYKYNGYLFATSREIQRDFLSRLFKDITPNSILEAPGLQFVPASFSQDEKEGSVDSTLKVFYSGDPEDFYNARCNFDWKTYNHFLTSKHYGRLVVYADVVTSTMSVFDGICTKLATNSGPIAIARQQTKGQGRSSNKWLSPAGCAMFTLVVHIPVHSHLGSRLPFLQHITSVAVVHAIRSISGLENVNLRVKWPNDIYHGTTTKLGGVIVKSTIFRDMCIASIGCGINICNKKPTLCVNDIMKEEYSIERSLNCEEVIARTVSSLESLVEEFQKSGPELFLKLYYKYWIHSKAEVSIELDGVMADSTIVGVDDCGFLLARRHDNGVVVSLQPDGNTFDIMKNLIVSKKAA